VPARVSRIRASGDISHAVVPQHKPRGSITSGIFMVLVGLALIVIGYIQHRSVVMTAKPPNGAPEVSQWPAVTAAATCALACALLAAYLAATVP
jgi:drug/metabolite transporter (DMT)-like permease